MITHGKQNITVSFLLLLGRETEFLRSKYTTVYMVAQIIAITVTGKGHDVKYQTSMLSTSNIFARTREQ